jgi:uncharacterized protein
LSATEPAQEAQERLASLDLIRGLAVLGILAVNIYSFAAAPSALYSPDLPKPGSALDHWTWLAVLVLFEGKMRMLFSVLFGASLMLFVERADAAGGDGEHLQVRRLGWLALFGYLHYLLLWDGDILFLYAIAGLIALFLRHAPPLALVASALFLLTIWQAWGWSMWRAPVAAEAAVAAGTASPAQEKSHGEALASNRRTDAEELARVQGSGAALIAYKALADPFRPVRIVFYALGETLALVLIGIALFKTGLFARVWQRRWLLAVALGGIGLGGAATGVFAIWANGAGYPEIAMRFAVSYGLTFAHLAMGLGYAAMLILGTRRLERSAIGARLIAAGRTAFSNYLGTSVLMCGVFYGWGLGLSNSLGTAAQFGVVILAWTLMLLWSGPWLARLRQGPLEWLWRSLTENRRLPLCR